LRLTASAGLPTGGGSYHRVDGDFRRIRSGDGKIGRIAATGIPLIVPDVRGDEDWLANPGWASRQGVRSFAGLPLIAAGQTMGVLAIFSREFLPDDAIGDIQFVAQVVACRLRSLWERPASEVLTRNALRDLERRSIEAALAQTNGKVFGRDGAAALLQVKPTTLASRIKALGITPPR
jgi:transcriptional regulator with GAF, ATPase, and Fis domain